MSRMTLEQMVRDGDVMGAFVAAAILGSVTIYLGENVWILESIFAYWPI